MLAPVGFHDWADPRQPNGEGPIPHGVGPEARWMRGHVPLIFAGGQLAAVADLWIADWAAAAPGDAGLRIVWTGHAPIW